MRPTASPVRFGLELERKDDHSCRIRVYCDGNDDAQVLLHEVYVAAEFAESAQRQALKAVARHLHWYMDPEAA